MGGQLADLACMAPTPPSPREGGSKGKETSPGAKCPSQGATRVQLCRPKAPSLLQAEGASEGGSRVSGAGGRTESSGAKCPSPEIPWNRLCRATGIAPLRGDAATRSEQATGVGLLRSEDAVTRIAKPWHDVAVFVQSAVHGRRVDGHIGMVVVEVLDAFRAGH